jgi:hypothetical protein
MRDQITSKLTSHFAKAVFGVVLLPLVEELQVILPAFREAHLSAPTPKRDHIVVLAVVWKLFNLVLAAVDKPTSLYRETRVLADRAQTWSRMMPVGTSACIP